MSWSLEWLMAGDGAGEEPQADDGVDPSVLS